MPELTTTMSVPTLNGAAKPRPAAPPRVPPAGLEVAVVIPAFNEEQGVGETVARVRTVLDGVECRAEIVVVDDGSTDATAARAAAAGARVIALGSNGGYGAALKAGIAATTAEHIVILDADGTYPPEAIPGLLALAERADMVVGARDPAGVNMPLVRRPAKWLLARLASYLAGRSIPDLNSGLRVLRRSVLRRFVPILPAGFSFTTTSTLALLCTNHRVVYEPIAYGRRVGSSKIRPTDFLAFLILIVRTITLFNPLKVFLPVGAFLFLVGSVKFVYDVFLWNLSESAVMAILAAVVIWALGLLADMISRLILQPPQTN